MTEVFSFLDLPAVLPQLRALSLHQRLDQLNYGGDKNDEEEIRAFLLRRYSSILGGLRLLSDGSNPRQEFDDLDALKMEIMMERSKHTNLSHYTMMMLYTETVFAMKKEVKVCERNAKEILEMKVTDDLQQSHSVDELTEMMERLTIDQTESDEGVESLLDAIQSLKIDVDTKKVSFEEGVTQIHQEVIRRLSPPPAIEFDFLFPSFSKTFFIF